MSFGHVIPSENWRDPGSTRRHLIPLPTWPSVDPRRVRDRKPLRHTRLRLTTWQHSSFLARDYPLVRSREYTPRHPRFLHTATPPTTFYVCRLLSGTQELLGRRSSDLRLVLTVVRTDVSASRKFSSFLFTGERGRDIPCTLVRPVGRGGDN